MGERRYGLRDDQWEGTRYDKTARNFLAAVYLAATAIWLIG
jgi:hypothetical protein